MRDHVTYPTAPYAVAVAPGAAAAAAAHCRAVPLTNFPNCSSKNSSSFLPAGLYVCEVQGLLERGQADAFSFDIAEATDSTRPYRLLLALTTVDGSAQL